MVARGYLTLNLLKYTHPILSVGCRCIFMLLGGIGLPGGAVYVDRHSVRARMGDSLISAAGPAVNVLFTIALTVPFWFGVESYTHQEFWAGMAFLAFLQLTASLLNLLPVPGLDGGNMLRPWLSYEWGRGFDVVAPFGMLALFLLLFEPRVNRIFFDSRVRAVRPDRPAALAHRVRPPDAHVLVAGAAQRPGRAAASRDLHDHGPYGHPTPPIMTLTS